MEKRSPARQALHRQVIGLMKAQDMRRDPIAVARLQREIDALEGEAIRLREREEQQYE